MNRMKQAALAGLLLFSLPGIAQEKLTPETLWKLGRVSALGLSKDKNFIVYSVSTPNATTNKSSRKTYKIAITGGSPIEVTDTDALLTSDRNSPDGKYQISSDAVKINK